MSKTTISKTDFLAFLRNNFACYGAMEFVENFPSEDAEDIFDAYTRSGWLEFLFDCIGLDGSAVWEKANTKADKKFPDWMDRSSEQEAAYSVYVCDLMRKDVPWSKVVKALTE